MTIPETTAATFAGAFSQHLADEVATTLSCSEVEALAELLSALGRHDLGAAWIGAHAEQDDEGDMHYREPH